VTRRVGKQKFVDAGGVEAIECDREVCGLWKAASLVVICEQVHFVVL
jgi:hypothetical protein